MNNSDFDFVIKDQLDVSRRTLISKNSAYANQDEDRLHAFKAAAELQGIDPTHALAGMMAKHTISIYDMIGSDKTFDVEVWTEKITDHINYLLLLKALVLDDLLENDDTLDIDFNEYTIPQPAEGF